MRLQKIKSFLNNLLTAALGKDLAFALAKAIPNLASALSALSSIYVISFAMVSAQKQELLIAGACLAFLSLAFGMQANKGKTLSQALFRAVVDYGYLSSVIVSGLGLLFLFRDSLAFSATWFVTSLLVAAFRLSFNQTILVSHQAFKGKNQTNTRSQINRRLVKNGVSVVIPCRNGMLYLQDAVESVLSQTYTNWELIIVDDCSTDETLRTAHELSLLDSRIRVIHLRKNVGLPGARNSGFMISRGKYVLFLDSDDALLPDCLEKRISLIGRSNDAWGAGAKTKQVEAKYDWRSLKDSNSSERVEKITLGSISANSPFAVHEIMLKSSVFRSLGGFDEALVSGAEDADFWLRALRSGARFYRSESPDSVYRQHQDSMISTDVVRQAEQTIEVIQKSLRGKSGGFSYVETLEAQAVQTRLFQFIGMTLAPNDESARAKLIGMLSTQEYFVLPPEIAFFEIKKGLNRNLKRNDILLSDDESAELIMQIEEIAERYSTSRMLGAVEELALQGSKSVVFVETAGQMKALNDSLLGLPDEHLPTLIIAEAFTGNQGAMEVLDSMGRTYQTLSLTQYQLRGPRFSNFFVFEPLSWLAFQLLNQAHLENSTIFSISTNWSELVTVEDDDYKNTLLTELNSNIQCISLDQMSEYVYLGEAVSRVQRSQFNVSKLVGVSRSGTQGDYEGLVNPDFDELDRFKNMYSGQKCIIIGNGPSLNLIDFSLFKDTPTFGVNSIFLAKDRLPNPITFYVVEDTKVFEENELKIFEFAQECDNAFLPTLYKDRAKDQGKFTFFRMNGGFYRKDDPYYCHPRFSFSINEVTYCGQSVTMQNLQLAFWMGFTEIALVGMDFSYTIPKETEVIGHHYHSKGDDPNHFDKSYFGAGKTWKDPRLNRVAANYELAKTAYEAAGRNIYNCTVGGNLEVFERVSLEEFLGTKN